ncbi:MAG TPA: aldehyde dehydrogenase family protein [Polyangia bacterium]|jgi:acyl-CoA reductase-like NAD-dependent aldehyde dehydrogenase
MCVSAPENLRIVNPATLALIREVPCQNSDDLARAVQRARAAQPAWAALSLVDRGRGLRRLTKHLLADREAMDTLVAESGKPRYEAELIELFYTCELTRFYTGRVGRRALRDDLRHPLIFANKRARVVYHPRGVVGVIGPWNWPMLNNFADCVAPLMAGNAVVLKPSERTPLTSLRLQTLWQECGLPPDVFQVVVGKADVGRALCNQADMIFFTGSQAAGREVARTAGERLIPAVVELGGKSAMLVLADADLARAAHAAVWSGFAHSGQVCIRTERVLVEAAVADRFVELCAEEIRRLRQGPPTGDADAPVGIDIGAITFPRQIAVAQEHIADAVSKGARVVVGGAARGDLSGQFFAPTLLADATPDMKVMREETFGPVLPVMRVADAAEAVRVANDSTLGLSGSVWSGSASRGREIARQLQAGSVCVNDALVNYFCVEAPLGGVKQSGLGVRHGPEGLRQFCRIETIVEDHPLLGFVSAFVDRQLTFPYRLRTLRFVRWLMRRLYG